jgi:hypothetical protein
MDAIALTRISDQTEFKVAAKNIEDMRNLVAAEILNGCIYRPVPRKTAE